MSDKLKVSVMLKWRGNNYVAGRLMLGFIRGAFNGPGFVAAIINSPVPATVHATKAEAKAAVEAAVIEAMGGKRE